MGSFSLNLLVDGDLDVYFEPKDPKILLEVFAEGMKNAALIDEVKTIRFESYFSRTCATMPEKHILQNF